jgi:hypothetical protein
MWRRASCPVLDDLAAADMAQHRAQRAAHSEIVIVVENRCVEIDHDAPLLLTPRRRH